MHKTDDAEFREFVAGRSGALLRTAYLLTGDYQLAEDLLQTALTKTYLSWDRIRDHGSVESYVRTTLVTTQTSWWRRRWWGERPVGEMWERSGDDAFAPLDERDLIWRFLSCLPPRQRARQTTSCRADPMTVSGQFPCPPAGNSMTVHGQFLVAADRWPGSGAACAPTSSVGQHEDHDSRPRNSRRAGFLTR